MSWWSGGPRTPSLRIDERLFATFGSEAQARAATVRYKDIPSFRYVDLYRAIEQIAAQHGASERIPTYHPQEYLGLLLVRQKPPLFSRAIQNSALLAWPVDAGEEISLPIDCFWLLPNTRTAGSAAVIRMQYISWADQARLEVAGRDEEQVTELLDAIVERSLALSVFRGKLVEIAYSSAARDEYGDPERPGSLRVQFRANEIVADEDFIVSSDVLELLRRNVLDLFNRREIMRKLGIPVRRGVLLYGPPGTGKTFACRYLCSRLPEVTKIVVAGSALFQVGSAFSLARMLQPALIVLEDVDLVFTMRDASAHSAVIGDLLDQMDGLRPQEDIGFILTTNALHRLEPAIRDRPGRISQLIHVGAPDEDIREKYLARYVSIYRPAALDLRKLAKMSAGTTQAFLKEWVHRSAQVASERLSGPDEELDLRDADFEVAMTEMKRFSEGAAGRIIGFQDV